MASALVDVCVDPRLNHELIRAQVRQRLDRSGIKADRVYLVNNVGANPGNNVRDTVQLLLAADEPIVFCAVLHHDDCLAAKHGRRKELLAAAQHLSMQLDKVNVRCPVLTGHIRTATNQVLWSDEPEWRYVPFTFGPG